LVHRDTRNLRDEVYARSVETADGHDGVQGDDAFTAGHLAGHLLGVLGGKLYRRGLRRAEGKKQSGGGSHAGLRIRSKADFNPYHHHSPGASLTLGQISFNVSPS